MKIMTKNEAVAAGLKTYFTGNPCIRGHTCERRVANGSCVQCSRQSAKAIRDADIAADREKSRQWYAKNKDRAAAWKRNWVSNNRDQYKANRKRWRMKKSTRAKEMLASTRWAARKKGIPHELELDWIVERLRVGTCELTGISFNLEPLDGGRQNPYTASIDRIDCSRGYVIGNVRMILWALNVAFNTYGEQVYADVAKTYLSRHGRAGLS